MKVLSVLCVVGLLLSSCGSRNSDQTQSVDESQLVQAGQNLFNQNCSSCHNFKSTGIGPQLGGLTNTVSEDWIRKFIKDPKAMIESGDERSQMLFGRFNTYMPAFASYTDQEVNGLIAFLKTKEAPPQKELKTDGTELKDPIPGSIAMSPLVVDLEVVTTIPPSSDEGQKTRICKLDVRPDNNAMYIVDLRGKLYELQSGKPSVYLDIAKEKPNFIHKPGLATGFGSFAFHPEFAKNGLLYTTHVEKPGSGKADFAYADSIKVMLQWVLTEWKTETPDGFPFKGKGREMLRINMVHSFHGVQEITFNPLAKPGAEDYGLLYIGIGDGSSVEMGYPFLAHSKEKIWGTIIRIDPKGRNSSNKQYGIPLSNPYVNDKEPGVLKEIYAMGFRNPHRISWAKDGRILSSNIGHHNVEALNIIMAGHDYGWPLREGTFEMRLENMNVVYPLPKNDAEYRITYPVAQYDHDEGNAISGGLEYWGNSLQELKGKYLFGDIVKGRMFYVEMKDLKVGSQAPIYEYTLTLNGQKKTLVELCGEDKVDVRFGRDHAGEMYIMTKPDGKVYRMVSASKKTTI